MDSHKVLYISYYDWYDRMFKSSALLKKRGYEVKFYTSNFNHTMKKADIEKKNENMILVKVPKYKKNISIKRIYSLWIFSKKIKRILQKENPALVYCVLPPNSLAKSVICRKKNYKVIFDIIDLWPESMPFANFKESLIYKKWQHLRDDYISKADFVITECDLYQEKLDKRVKEKVQTIYLSRPKSIYIDDYSFEMDRISLCYLGSINNIIDLEGIARIIKGLGRYKPVVLHIIGKGEKTKEFIDISEKAGALVYNHGVIFDEEKKQEIFRQCHYGLNVYKESTCIGITIKSIDYLEYGLPIINSIGVDTERLVDTYGCGYNVKNIDFEQASCCYNLKLRERSREVFNLFFTDEIFKKKVSEIFDKLGVENNEEENRA